MSGRAREIRGGRGVEMVMTMMMMRMVKTRKRKMRKRWTKERARMRVCMIMKRGIHRGQVQHGRG